MNFVRSLLVDVRRHKLFYIIFISLLILACYIIVSTKLSFAKAIFKYCNEASTLQLSSFNSIFELCTAFCFTFTVIIKFRSSLKFRTYTKLKGKLVNILTNKGDDLEPHLQPDVAAAVLGSSYDFQKLIKMYISDLDIKLEQENENVKNDKSHRAADSFLYFAFYSIVCLIISGMLDGLGFFHFELLFFLVVFSFLSILSTFLKYLLLKISTFEFNLLLFVSNALLSFFIAQNFGKFDLIDSFSLILENKRFFFDENNQYLVAKNYCFFVIIATNIYPYILFFNKFYFVTVQYNCTLITLKIRIQLQEKNRKMRESDKVNLVQQILDIFHEGKENFRSGINFKNGSQ